MVNQLNGYTSDTTLQINKYQQPYSSTPISHQEYAALQNEICSRMAVQVNNYSLDFCGVVNAIKCLNYDGYEVF